MIWASSSAGWCLLIDREMLIDDMGTSEQLCNFTACVKRPKSQSSQEIDDHGESCHLSSQTAINDY